MGSLLHGAAPPLARDDGAEGDITGNKRKAEAELCEGGRDKDVTNENKAEYLRLLPVALLQQYTDGIGPQTAAFRRGMTQQLGGNEHVLRRFCRLVTPSDFDLLVGGQPEIDVGEWEEHTEVHHAPAGSAAEGAPVVAWFWALVRELTAAQRAQLLQFATGCGRVPVGGFAGLMGYQGRTHGFRLDVLPFDARRATVTASTCFNTLRIRRYASRDELRRRLLSALANARRGGFFEGAH